MLDLLLLATESKHSLNLACGSAAKAVHSSNRPANTPRDDSKPLIGEEADEDGPGDTDEAGNDAYSPLSSIDASGLDLEGAATDEDDEGLEADDHDDDADEDPIAEDTLEHIELVVETAVVEDVEDLHPDEAVEDERVELELHVGVGKVIAEDVATGKV